MKKIFDFFWELIKITIIALIIVFPIRYFIFQPFLVWGESMEPSFETGDYLIVDEISYRFREPKRGEVIVFNNPYNPSQRFIKRIIGLPGEKVKLKEGKIIISNKKGEFVLDESSYLPVSIKTTPKMFDEITLRENEYFVLGDNREVSVDSRNFGPLPRKNIIGRVIIRAWPFNKLSIFENGLDLWED